MTPDGKCEVCGLCAEDRDLHIHQLHEKVKRLEKAAEERMGRVCELMAREEELEVTFAHIHAAKYIDNKLVDECKFCGLDFRDDIHSALMNKARAALAASRKER